MSEGPTIVPGPESAEALETGPTIVPVEDSAEVEAAGNGPTLEPTLADADTLPTLEDAMTVTLQEAGTLRTVESNGATVPSELKILGTPEDPVSLVETDPTELGDEAAYETAETVRADSETVRLGEAETVADSETVSTADEVPLEQAGFKAGEAAEQRISAEMDPGAAFDARLAQATDLGFPTTFRVGGSVDVPVNYQLYSDWKRELALKQDELKKAGVLKRWMSMGATKSRVKELRVMVNGVDMALKKSQEKAKAA